MRLTRRWKDHIKVNLTGLESDDFEWFRVRINDSLLLNMVLCAFSFFERRPIHNQLKKKQRSFMYINLQV
jgi:hypothetical protein